MLFIKYTQLEENVHAQHTHTHTHTASWVVDKSRAKRAGIE